MKNDKIVICDFFSYRGRNIYCTRPVIKMIVDIGKYADIPTKDIKGFNQRLLKAFPGLKTNYCGLGFEGGFLEKLNNGTYLAHVLEHVILEMQYMLGYDVRYGKTRVLEDPTKYYSVYEYKNEVCGLECGKAAVFILNRFIKDEDVNVEEFFNFLKKVSIKTELGLSTKAIVEEAEKRGIPVYRIGNESLVQLGYGKYCRLIMATLTDATSCISADISTNKQLTKAILSEHHIPVPYGRVVYSEISAAIAANQLGMPVVLKPFDGNQGKGVFLNLNSEAEIKEAFRQASKYSNGIIVEKHLTGKDYRVLVVGNKVCAVAERRPAMVIGDGTHTVSELVDMVNKDDRRGDGHEKPLTKIKLDDVAKDILEKNNMTFDSVPEKGQVVKLRANGNLSTGGTAIDCTDIIHPDNAELSVLAANAIGIDIAGIDIVTDDISKSIIETDGAIVEVNTTPGIRMHLYPSEGQLHYVQKDIVDHLFPSRESYNFPIISVTGTNGKTTTVRLLSHVLTKAGKTVGMTSTSGTFIKDRCICRGDNSGPRSARTLLSNRLIDIAVLETARGGILREGLGYDLADVGVVMNIGDDHLGNDGIKTLDDLAFVKSLVTESVKDGGYAVFNAMDSMTARLIERTKARVVLFSQKPIEDSDYKNYIHVYADDGYIFVRENSMVKEIVRIEEIPITMGGLIQCNIENSLAATAVLYALNIPFDIIANGLKTFENNAGRFSLFSLNDFHVMLDYGHNLAGYEQVINTCKKIDCKGLIGVVGMPGDRPDEQIKSVSRLCVGVFDKIYIKEDINKRLRQRNEVSKIMYDEIINAGFDKDKIEVIENEVEALKSAISAAESHDLIVVFYENYEPLRQYLMSVGAKEGRAASNLEVDTASGQS